jgi:hypothetical protein
VSQLLEYTGLAAAISLYALGFSVMQRTLGVFCLEISVAAFSLAIPSAVAWNVMAGASPDRDSTYLVFVCLTALIAACALTPLYRAARQTKGGDSMALLMSLTSMNCLTMLATSLTGGKSVTTRLILVGVAPVKAKMVIEIVAVGVGVAAAILATVWQRHRPSTAALFLAKDNDRLVSSFGHSPSVLRYVGLGVAFALVLTGAFLFVGMQEFFSLTDQEALLIPAFGLALLSERVGSARIVAGSLVFVVLSHFATVHGQPILQRAYEGGLFCALIVGAALGGRLVPDLVWKVRRGRRLQSV